MVIFFHDLEHETTTCFTIGDYSLCYSHVLSQILSKYLLSIAKINIPNVICFGLPGLKKNGGRKISKDFPSWSHGTFKCRVQTTDLTLPVNLGSTLRMILQGGPLPVINTRSTGRWTCFRLGLHEGASTTGWWPSHLTLVETTAICIYLYIYILFYIYYYRSTMNIWYYS